MCIRDRTTVEAPENRLATFRYQEYAGIVHSKMQIIWDMICQKPNIDITPLIQQYGRYPTSFIEDRVNGKPIKF